MPVSKLGFNGSVHIVKFDLRPFRSFNNTLGYSEADAVFSEFVERIERAGTGLRLVRSGGSIFALSPEPIPDEVVSGVSEQISDLYREKILTAPAGVKMQFELDRARGLLDGLQRGAPFEVLAKLAEDRFNRPGVSAQRTWTGDPNTPIYDVINSA
jgi:GGDEF domain-containing protein